MINFRFFFSMALPPSLLYGGILPFVISYNEDYRVNSKVNSMNEDSQATMTDFDSMVSPEPVQIMKACIPYVPPRGQRILSLYAKALEFQNTLSVFRQSQPDLSICSAPNPSASGNPLEMMNDIRKHCSPNTQHKIDDCINMFAMIQMMEVFQENDQ